MAHDGLLGVEPAIDLAHEIGGRRLRRLRARTRRLRRGRSDRAGCGGGRGRRSRGARRCGQVAARRSPCSKRDLAIVAIVDDEQRVRRGRRRGVSSASASTPTPVCSARRCSSAVRSVSSRPTRCAKRRTESSMRTFGASITLRGASTPARACARSTRGGAERVRDDRVERTDRRGDIGDACRRDR